MIPALCVDMRVEHAAPCFGPESRVAHSSRERLLLTTLLCWSLMISALSAVASPSAPREGKGQPAADQDFGQLNHTVFTPRDGAPAEILDIVEGKDGYLWLGTSVGITRFDGIRFEHDPIPGFPRQGVYTVKPDNNGDLWVGFLKGGVAWIRENRITLLDDKDIPGGSIFDIVRLKDGTQWIVGSRGITFRSGDGPWKKVDAAMGYEPAQPNATAEAPDGSMLIMDGERAYSIGPGDTAFREVTPDEFVRIAVEIPAGNSWRPGDREYGIPDSAGTHWIVTENGIDRYHWRADGTPRIEHIGRKEGLTSDSVNGIYKDDSGNVWVRTDFALERFRPNRVTRVVIPGDASNPVMERDAHDGIWFSGGGRDVLYHATREGVASVDAKTSIGAMFLSRDGTLLTAGANGIEFRGERNRRRIPLPAEAAKVSPRLIQCLSVDRDDIVTLGILRFGVYSWQGSEWLRVIPPEQYGPVQMTMDPDGRLWSIYSRNLVTVADRKNITSYDATKNVDLGYLLAIDADGNGVWIGGKTGIQFLREGRFETLVTRDNALTGISGLARTPAGDLWANSDRGLALIARHDIDESVRDPTHVNDVQWFDFNDGIEGTPSQLRPLPTLEHSPDGRIWASTNQGIFWIDPANFKRDQRNLTGRATNLIADGKNIELRSDTEVPRFTHALQIDYTAPELSMAPRLRFRYRLDPIETDWQNAGERRSAFYTSLPPGKYEFHLRVANTDGIWGEEHRVASFHLLPGWYQTRWFKIACALLGILIVAGGLLLRDRRLAMRRQVRMAERERIARELHDTLLQGTQGLIYHVGSALRKTSEPALRITLIDAMERAQDALVEVRERVNALRENDKTPVDFVELLRLAVKTITHGHELYSDIEVDGVPRLLAASAAAELATVCQEALSNVVAHAAARSIIVRISFRRRSLIISISDDGDGIDEAVLRAGGREGHWGLSGMRERVELFQGRIDIDARAGGGTVVSIRVHGPSVYAR